MQPSGENRIGCGLGKEWSIRRIRAHAVAAQGKMNTRCMLCNQPDSLQKHVVILDRGEPGAVADEQGVCGQIKFSAKLETRGRVWTIQPNIKPVGKDFPLLGGIPSLHVKRDGLPQIGDHSGGNFRQRCIDAQYGGGHAVGRGKIQVGVANIPDHGRTARKKRSQQSQKIRMIKPGLDNIRAEGSEHAHETKDSAGWGTPRIRSRLSTEMPTS